MSGTFRFVCTDGEFTVSKKHFNDIGGLFPELINGTYIRVQYTISQMKEAWFIICDAILSVRNKPYSHYISTSLNLPYSLYPLFDLLELKFLTKWQSYIGKDYEYVGICRWLLHDHNDMPHKLVIEARAGLQEYMRKNIDIVIEILESDDVEPDLAIKYFIATGICNTYGLVDQVIDYYYEDYDVGKVDKLLAYKLNFPVNYNPSDTFDVNEFVIGGVEQYYDEFFKL